MTTATPHAQGHAHDAHGDHAAHPPHLAHHFDTPEQQAASGKLGMWAFLGTELLMFGGLFCAYAVYRHNHPDVFLFSHVYLDKIWGGINTAVLIASSFTMAWAVRAAQLGQRNLCRVLLALTFMGGVGFMCIKFVEYKSKWEHYLMPGSFNAFNPLKGTPEKLKEALDYREHHGGTPHEATDATEATSSHAAATPAPATPAPATPADHGTTAHSTAAPHAAASHSATSHSPGPTTQIVSPGYKDPHRGTGDEAKIYPTFIQPVGLAAAHATGHRRVEVTDLNTLDLKRVNTFFGIYFIMTGLHGVHVLVGMGIIAWLFLTVGRYSPDYYTPVDIGGLYWHLVDLIWIFLFPLLYLIH